MLGKLDGHIALYNNGNLLLLLIIFMLVFLILLFLLSLLLLLLLLFLVLAFAGLDAPLPLPSKVRSSRLQEKGASPHMGPCHCQGLHCLRSPHSNQEFLFNLWGSPLRPFPRMLASLGPSCLHFLFLKFCHMSFCFVPCPPRVWKSILFHCKALTMMSWTSSGSYRTLDPPGCLT